MTHVVDGFLVDHVAHKSLEIHVKSSEVELVMDAGVGLMISEVEEHVRTEEEVPEGCVRILVMDCGIYNLVHYQGFPCEELRVPDEHLEKKGY